jgi:diaminopimelate decarboxylase
MSSWPLTAEPAVSVGGVRLTEIAERFGTPACVLDEEHVRVRCREYVRAMAQNEVAYAAGAFWCRAMARWIAEEGLSLGACSEGELVVARAAGFPGRDIVLHGSAKTARELSAALDYGVGRVVIHAPSEVAQLAALAGQRQKVLVGVTEGDAAAEVARRIVRQPALELVGVYCHVGPRSGRTHCLEAVARRLVDFTAGLGGLPELHLGGGDAVPSRSGDRALEIVAFARRLTSAVEQESAARRIPVPRLTVGFGRAIVGLAGVTLYRVLSVKHGPRTSVVVDGDMCRGAQPAPHGGRRDIVRIGHPAVSQTEPMAVVGRYCGAGDALAGEALLPRDICAGDLLAVPCTGAGQLAMASSYHHVARPPVIAARGGRAWPLIRRETDEDLLRRDIGWPPALVSNRPPHVERPRAQPRHRHGSSH